MIQKLLGHNDIKTTMIYLHTSNKDLLKIISLLDDLKFD
jgi:site-specific recombinase XerD